MYFHQDNAELPLELFVIRAAAGAETPSERADLLAAWRQVLAHGPTAPRRRIKKILPPAPPAPFTSDSAGVPLRRIAELENLLEIHR